MRVDFDYVKFKNIGSYGNEMTTVEFSKGVNLISAPNGSGKSYIIEAIVFCLTGKPYRKLKKIKNLINRINKKGLYIEVGFHIGKKYWRVIRTLGPDTLSYALRQKDGTYKDLDTLSSKSLDQAEIEKIFKIDPFMIKQIVVLDVSYNKPFLSFIASETRAILESVFNLSIFFKMLQEVKVLLGGFESDLKVDEKFLNYLTSDLTNQRNNLVSIREMIASFNIIKQDAINKIEKQINSIKLEILEHNENIKDAEEYLAKNEIKSIDTTMSLIKTKESKISDLRHNMKTKVERLALLSNGKCPTCKTSFKNDFNLELEQTELKDSIKTIDIQINILLEKITELESTLKADNESNSEIKEIEFALKHESANLINLREKEIELEQQRIDEATKKMAVDIKSIENKLIETELKRKTFVSGIEDLEKSIVNFKDVKKVLSDKGVKAYLMSKFIPLLNSKVQDYLEKFDLNVVVSFNELMQVEIFNPKQPDSTIEYEAFSKGEKKRLDMAILLSFIRVTKEICNWHCNIMFLDELLDGGLDGEGLDKVGTAIKSMVDEDDLCVYTISHRKLSYNLFNNYLFIEKDKYGFSNIAQPTK